MNTNTPRIRTTAELAKNCIEFSIQGKRDIYDYDSIILTKVDVKSMVTHVKSALDAERKRAEGLVQLLEGLKQFSSPEIVVMINQEIAAYKQEPS